MPLDGLDLKNLLVGDPPAQEHVDSGVSFTTVLDEIVAPAMVVIGSSWHDGQLSIAEEHRATAIVERLIGDHNPNPRGRPPGPPRGAGPPPPPPPPPSPGGPPPPPNNKTPPPTQGPEPPPP
ncbi:MAG: B12-binding domain-containing protein, partial [Verrucomicrobiota bacterium]